VSFPSKPFIRSGSGEPIRRLLLLSPEMLAILFGYSYVITDLIVEKARFLEKYRNILGLRIVFFSYLGFDFYFQDTAILASYS
jgi:hypothetical protein